MHPATCEGPRFDIYAEAMRLVGAKRSKGGLVELVNWLLHRIADETTVVAHATNRIVGLCDAIALVRCGRCGAVKGTHGSPCIDDANHDASWSKNYEIMRGAPKPAARKP